MRFIYKTIAIIAGALIFAAAVLITFDAAIRYIWNKTSIWQNELAIYFIMASIWLGAGSAMLANWHVAIKFTKRFVGTHRYRYVRMISQLICVFVGAVLSYYSLLMTVDAIETGRRASTIWAPHLTVPYGIVAIGMTMFTCAALYNLSSLFMRGEDDNYKVLEQ